MTKVEYQVEIQYEGIGDYYPVEKESYESYEEALAVFHSITAEDIKDSNKRFARSHTKLFGSNVSTAEIILSKTTSHYDEDGEFIDDDYDCLKDAKIAYFYENADRAKFEQELRDQNFAEMPEEKEEFEEELQEELAEWDEDAENIEREYPINNLIY